MSDNKKALKESDDNNFNDIITQNDLYLNSLDKMVLEDFAKSGIDKEIVIQLSKNGYLAGLPDGWKLIYPKLYDNIPTNYYNYRHFDIKEGQSKYSKPSGECSRLFRPPMLSPEIIKDTNEPIIIVEGEKKAIKGVLEGFYCLGLSGVYAWKMKPKNQNEDETEDMNNLLGDIIPDIVNFNFKNRTIYLCYDNDMLEKPQVKKALYHFSGYLICERKADVKIIKLPKCNDKLGLDDYLIKYGKDEFKKLIDKAQPLTLKTIQAELSNHINDSIYFPIEIFDAEIKKLVLELQKRYDAPIEYIAVALLSCFAILLDCRAEILINNASEWKEPPICWFAIVGNPSQKKTPCLKIAKNILDKYDLILQQDYQKNYEKYCIEYTDYKTKLSIYKNEVKQGNTNIKIPIEPQKPLKSRLTTQDATTEALCYAINSNKAINRGIAIFTDELAYLLNGLNQYKKGGNDTEYLLQTWDKKLQNIVRQGGAIDYTISAGHNIIGTIQPSILDKTIFSNGVNSTNGMIERWLFVCTQYSESGELPDYNTSHLDMSAIQKRCDKLFYSDDKTRQYYLSQNAYEYFREFYKNIAKQFESDKITDLMKNYLSKQRSYVIRFALILHCIESPEKLEVSAETLEKAIKLSTYFIQCFKNITAERISKNPYEEYAINYLNTRNIKTISPTELKKKNTSLFKSLEQAKNALEGLAENGYGRICKSGTRGWKFLIHN